MTIGAGFDHHPNCSARASCHATRASYEFSPQQHRAHSNDGRSGGTQCQRRRASKRRRQLLALSMRSACGDAQPSGTNRAVSGAAGRPSRTRLSFARPSPLWVLQCLLDWPRRHQLSVETVVPVKKRQKSLGGAESRTAKARILCRGALTGPMHGYDDEPLDDEGPQIIAPTDERAQAILEGFRM